MIIFLFELYFMSAPHLFKNLIIFDKFNLINEGNGFVGLYGRFYRVFGLIVA